MKTITFWGTAKVFYTVGCATLHSHQQCIKRYNFSTSLLTFVISCVFYSGHSNLKFFYSKTKTYCRELAWSSKKKTPFFKKTVKFIGRSFSLTWESTLSLMGNEVIHGSCAQWCFPDSYQANSSRLHTRKFQIWPRNWVIHSTCHVLTRPSKVPKFGFLKRNVGVSIPHPFPMLVGVVSLTLKDSMTFFPLFRDGKHFSNRKYISPP